MKDRGQVNMEHEFFQVCYAHPDTGWAIVNASADIPKKFEEDFSSVERANAGMAAGTKVPMGESESPSCMWEIYCRNNAVGLVRTQYSLSDGQGRPVSFSHGYIFPDAYELLKNPNDLLRIQKENFADQFIRQEKREEICAVPGAYNSELIKVSAVDQMPRELMMGAAYSYQSALDECGLSKEAYRTYITALYAYLFSTNTEKNLYVKTNGSERYAWNLLYLTYLALPYSMRSLLSASTYIHDGQHNSKLIFCYEPPGGAPQINPVTGKNNIMNEIVEKRTIERNPYIRKSLDYVVRGKQDDFFRAIECVLQLMGDEKLNTMQIINLAYSICVKEYDVPGHLPGLIYNWLTLPVKNTENWEKMVCLLLKKAREFQAELGTEVKKQLQARMESAVTEELKAWVHKSLT